MESSDFGDLTSRSIFDHASQEISKDITPLPVVQPTSKKKSTKRRRSALTIKSVLRPSEGLNISPRTAISSIDKEKSNRKSSVCFPKDDEILQLQQERHKSRGSLLPPADISDVSVDENEVTEERSILPDIADISAIAGCHKKQKLQLGKLDNRAYSKITEIKKKRSQAVNRSLQEEYEDSFWNDEPSVSFQQNSRAVSSETIENAPCTKSDSFSDTTSNVNLNTKAVKGSPLAEKQKPFTEKRIPHLSSDSDSTLHAFPSEADECRKSRKSATPKTASSVLSITHPLPSLGTCASSGKHSPNSRSPARTLPNILPQALHSETAHFSQLSGQNVRTSKFAIVSNHGTLSGGSGDADESSEEEEENADNNENILLQNVVEPAEVTKTASCHKSVSRSHVSLSFSKKKSSRSVFLDPHTNLEEQEEEEVGNDDGNLPPPVKVSKTTVISSPVSQKLASSVSLSEHHKRSMASVSESHSIANQVPFVSGDVEYQQEPRISSRKTLGASRKANKLCQNVFSENKSASFLDTHGASHISADSVSDVEESEADKDEYIFAGIDQGLEPSESVSLHPKKSMSRESRGVPKSLSSSSSYKIINPPGIDMYASPQIAEDASYQLSHQIKTVKTSARDTIIVSRKVRNSRKMSEVGRLTSSMLSTESSLSDPIYRKMHSTAIHDDNIMGTIHESSPHYLDESSSEVPHKGKIFGRRKISHIPKVSELQKPPLPGRSSASDGVTENDAVVQGNTYRIPRQNDISEKKSVSTSRRDKHAVQLSDQEELMSPVLNIQSGVSSSARKSMRSFAALDYEVAVEDILLQQHTVVPGRMSRKSVGTSGKDRRGAQVSVREQSPSPTSPVRSSVSGTKKKMHSDFVPDHSPSVEDTSQQVEISGRKPASSSQKEKYSMQLSDQENELSPASPATDRIRHTARKSTPSAAAAVDRTHIGTSSEHRHGAQVSDQEQSPVRSRVSGTQKRIHSDFVPNDRTPMEDASDQVSRQNDISGRKPAGTSRKGRHSTRLSDQENGPSPAPSVGPRVRRTARKSTPSSASAADRTYLGTSSKHRQSSKVFDQKQSESPSPFRSRVSHTSKRMHSDDTPDHNATTEDSLHQMSEQNEISGRKSVGASAKHAQLSRLEQSANQTSQAESRIPRTARMSMHSDEHNAQAMDAISQVTQQTEVLNRKSAGISRKDRYSTQMSDREQSISPTSPVRSRVSGTARKSVPSGRTFDHYAAAADVSRKERHSEQLSDQEQSEIPESHARSRVSGSTRKRMHSVGASVGDAVTETNVSGESSSEIPNQTVIHRRKVADGSSKPSGITKSPQMRHLTESSVQSSVLDSTKKKMHSTAIPDHDTLMKTVVDGSVSPIRTKEILVSGGSPRKRAPAVHTDFEEEAAEGSSSESSVESDKSPERVHERDLTLPPAVENHDEEAVQSEDRVPAARAPQQKKKKKIPRISSNETKRIVEHFAGMKISRGALNSIVESCDIFWQKTFETVEAYAKHANRETIEVQDVELLLYRQRLADDRQSMNALISQYMPLELRRKVIPMATPGNVVIP